TTRSRHKSNSAKRSRASLEGSPSVPPAAAVRLVTLSPGDAPRLRNVLIDPAPTELAREPFDTSRRTVAYSSATPCAGSAGLISIRPLRIWYLPTDGSLDGCDSVRYVVPDSPITEIGWTRCFAVPASLLTGTDVPVLLKYKV